MNAAEKTFLGLISGYKEAELIYAIRTKANLAELAKENQPQVVSMAKIMLGIFKFDTSELTTDNMMLYLFEKRPDLYRVLDTNPNGRIWLDWNVRNVKALLGI